MTQNIKKNALCTKKSQKDAWVRERATSSWPVAFTPSPTCLHQIHPSSSDGNFGIEIMGTILTLGWSWKKPGKKTQFRPRNQFSNFAEHTGYWTGNLSKLQQGGPAPCGGMAASRICCWPLQLRTTHWDCWGKAG